MKRRRKTKSYIGIKATIRRRDGLVCTQCGITNAAHIENTGRQLEVHRIVPGSLYTLEGCFTLCRECHVGKPKRQKNVKDLANPNLIHLWLDKYLMEVLDTYVEESDPQVSKTAVVESALREFFRTRGKWPPPQPPQEK